MTRLRAHSTDTLIRQYGSASVADALVWGFTAGLMLKDVNLFIAEAKALGIPIQVIEAVAALLKLTCDELGPDN